MTLQVDIAEDMALFDFVELVTYQERSLAGVVTASHANVTALRRKIGGEVSRFAQNAQASSDQAKWHLMVSSLPVTPKRGGRIVSASSGTWEVGPNEDDVVTLGTRYEAQTRKVAG